MATWPDNNERYIARLDTLAYLCNHFWRFLENGFNSQSLGEIPQELRDKLSYSDLNNIKVTMIANTAYCKDFSAQHYTVEELLRGLDWSFNPADIEGLKITRKAPHGKRPKNV